MREEEHLDDSVEIRGIYLKQKLKARYPLHFLKPIKINSSEIVFCKEGFSLADRWTPQSDLESTDCEFDSEGEGPQLDQQTSLSLTILWKLVMTSGGSYYLLLRTLYIYISTKGRKTMPKHVTLGLTMRHMTGSSSIIGISNGLRHSVSHSAVLEHDTALAYKQLCTDNIVPEGFIKKIPTTVIWNNIDFMEETPSGEGTTHNTNGFLVQRIGCVDDGTESISCINSESKHLPKKQKMLR